MTTLPEFIEIGRRHGRANLHLKVPDFQLFYARYGPRWLNGQTYRNVLDLASIAVIPRLIGTGVFTRFFHQIRKDYPDIPIYVENAAPLFQRLLLRLGFRRHEFNEDSFYFIEGVCFASTSTTGTTPEVGNSSGSGSEIRSAATGTTTTSKETRNESSEPAVSPESSSTTARSITSYKRRSPTWSPKDSKSPRKD